ncbi:MAG: YdgA family protein [Candidatus Dormibacteraeota bacterium]|nr:YdgA family protein [Candidatus Dormibacteraeota bacterium]
MRKPVVLIGLIVLAVVLALVGVYYQVTTHNPGHPVSYHAIAFWAAAVAALIAASFARPRSE